MSKLKLNHDNLNFYVKEHELSQMKIVCEMARDSLVNKTGEGNDFTGWIQLPETYDLEEFSRIQKVAEKIKKDSDVLIVIGIGGSYLGSKAAIDYLSSSFYNKLSKDVRKTPEIYFAGQNISASYINGLISIIGDRDFSVNVISKSGTTTEPAIAFRLFKNLLEKKYGKLEASKRIYATTDKKRGALKTVADIEKYETFVIPDDVGGRYSVLTAVGLLPIAVCGADISKLMFGAKNMMKELLELPFENNIAMKYAALRNILLRRGKVIEILANYEPQLHYFAEWWKQLFGESEGKDGKGIFPAAVDFSTDLHSMGQFIQDGSRNIFETTIHVENPCHDIEINKEENDLDGLNYLAGKTLNFVNNNAMYGVALAHEDGNVPNMRILANNFDEETLGELFYFFEFSCALSGYLNNINPFDQEGVENYKKNMFALLGKPGYEQLRKSLLEKISK